MFGKSIMSAPWFADSLESAARTAKRRGYDAVNWEGRAYCAECFSGSKRSDTDSEFGSCDGEVGSIFG